MIIFKKEDINYNSSLINYSNSKIIILENYINTLNDKIIKNTYILNRLEKKLENAFDFIN